MKKLMFAMAIAATVGFAQAEDTPIGTTTTFEGFTVDKEFSIDAIEGDAQWTAPNTQGKVTDTKILAYDKNAEDYDAANGDKYLSLEGVENLAKNINTAIGDDGLYIDTMVKFTASEDAPTPGEGDKLVVWLRENAVEGGDSTYTLMVTAGRIDVDGGTVVTQTYETDATVLPDTNWYNLKVKAIADVDIQGVLMSGAGVAGFVVFIDGVAVKTTMLPAVGEGAEEEFGTSNKYIDTANEQYALFPSLIDNSTAGAAEVKQLAFSGSGAIDTVAAFKGDCDPDVGPTTYAVTYSPIENATVVTDPADTTALAVGATVAFTVTPAENYEYATTPSGWTAGANGAITMTYTVVAGENVVTIPAPTAKSTDVIDPASGDVAVTVTAESEAAAVTAAKALVSVPAGATVDAAVYAEYFDYSAVAGEAGKYTVSITGVKDTVSAGVLESAVGRLTDDEATTIAVPAGLYYSITPSTGLPISGEAVKGLSTGGTVTVEKPGTTAGFYEVKVSATPIE